MKPGGGNPCDPSSVAAGGPGAAALGPGTASGNGGRSDSGTGPAGASTTSAPLTSGRPAGAVGDGGLSWRLKALKRAQEQATASGGSLGSIVAERWGSLTDLTASLTEGRAADGEPHDPALSLGKCMCCMRRGQEAAYITMLIGCFEHHLPLAAALPLPSNQAWVTCWVASLHGQQVASLPTPAHRPCPPACCPGS